MGYGYGVQGLLAKKFFPISREVFVLQESARTFTTFGPVHLDFLHPLGAEQRIEKKTVVSC